MTMQRDPQLIARIIEMRDAGMTRAQARYTLDMGVCQFRSIITEHGISGWAWTTPEVAAAHAERIRGMTVESVERGRWVRRMLSKMTHEERAIYQGLRTRKPVNTRLSVARAFEAVLKAKREATGRTDGRKELNPTGTGTETR